MPLRGILAELEKYANQVVSEFIIVNYTGQVISDAKASLSCGIKRKTEYPD